MIAARIVSYIVEYTAPAWHRRHVDSRPRRAIHPPISPYHGHPRSIPFVRPLNGQAEPPPWCSIIDTYPSMPPRISPAACSRCVGVLRSSLDANASPPSDERSANRSRKVHLKAKTEKEDLGTRKFRIEKRRIFFILI